MSISNPRTLKVGDTEVSRGTSADVMSVLDEYQRFFDATSQDRAREKENLEFYYGLDDGQWPSYMDIEQERKKGLHIGTYNLSSRKVDGIAGSISRNPFDVKYQAEDSDLDPLIEALQQAYLSDKEVMDWDAEDKQSTRYGLIYRSWLNMRVETQKPASPLGNIAIRCANPLAVIPDPNWKTISSKDLETLYVVGYMSTKKMKEVYNTKADQIENEIAMNEMFGQDVEENEGVSWNAEHPDTRGDQNKIVEKHYLETKKVQRSVDPATGTVFWEWMSDEEKLQLALENNIPGERLREEEVEIKVYKIKTVCPNFPTLVLEDAEHDVQIGRLPWFPWTATWVNGKCLGIIDFLKDAQREVNYRQATITRGAQGAVMAGVQVDEAVFGNDDQRFQDFKAGYGDSRQVVKTKSGASRQFPDAIKPLPRVQIAPELFQIVSQMVDLMDLLVPQPAAGEARTERSGESGIHFAQKLEVMKTLQSPMMEGRRQLWNDIGEAYMELSAQKYAEGRRKFRGKGRESLTINEEQFDGTIKNDFRKLSAMRKSVQISESPAGVNMRLANRELNTGLMGMWPGGAPNSQIALVENVLHSIDMTESQKENADNGLVLDRKLIESRTLAEIAQNEAIVKQTQGPAQGAQPAPGGPPAPGGGGVPGQEIQPMSEEMPVPGAPVIPEPAIANPPQMTAA